MGAFGLGIWMVDPMTSVSVYASYEKKLKVSAFATNTGIRASAIIKVEEVMIHVYDIEELDMLAAAIVEAREKLLALGVGSKPLQRAA